jgi:ribosomal protein S18 acetylase RimI-like enzyme
MAEWRHYIASLTNGTGCGWFAPEISGVVRDGHAPGMRGAIVMTDLGPGTAHVAQMAVDPALQGKGLGRALLSAALLKAAPLFARATLLVADSNHAAAALYATSGFRDIASFIVASRPS